MLNINLFRSTFEFYIIICFIRYLQLIRGMPTTDHPLAFGQHSNSDMAASLDDANTLIDTLVSLQPNVVKAVDEEEVDPMAAQCGDLLSQTAEPFEMRAVREKLESRSDPDPLKTVLYQELDRCVSRRCRSLTAFVFVAYSSTAHS